RYCGATPVFVDIQRETYNIDPSLVEAAIGPRTKAILAVHQLGMPCDLAAIVEIGKRRSIPVVEDAACAVGSEIRWNDRWERIGHPRGLVACFSFHPRKLLSTGDGGMLTTADPDLDRKARLLRQHGMSVSDTVRHSSSTVIQEEYPVLGYNYRMTDIQAAIGREQLTRLSGIVSRRRALAERYRERLADVAGVSIPTEPEWARTNWQSYAVRVDAGHRRRIMQRMLDAGIATRRGAMNAHREAAYPAGTWRAAGSLRESEAAQDAAIVLPLFHQLTEVDQDRVVDELARAAGVRG
ncbi:MAG TPA: DegT/DnrJ/EryC1/StrS family aminotransferase, partial [Vicinamibacterales bacterium]|nr:DegT/DnrJ/EryC1/StrS family aminotransferase [Vicinamibacterales bacterium]